MRHVCTFEDDQHTCTGRIHAEGLPFGLTCDDGCRYGFYPIQGECTTQADCLDWEACRIFEAADELRLVTDCYSVIPGSPNAGTRCQVDEDCFSGWCLDQGFCAGLCMLDADCPMLQTGRTCVTGADCPGQSPCEAGFCSVPGTCQTLLMELGPGPDGETVQDWVRLCLPESRPCEQDADCPGQQICQQRFAPTTMDGYELRCGPP